jgi:hypothetical protein
MRVRHPLFIMGKLLDLAGQKFNRLTAIERIDGKWLCICDCGRITKVEAWRLNNGNTKSCGCLHKESISLPETQIQDYISMYESGYTLDAIAEKYGVADTNVSAALKRRGYKLRNQSDCRTQSLLGKKQIEKELDWIAQYKFGLNLKQISARAKVNETTILKAFVKHDFQCRPENLKRQIKGKSDAELFLEVYQRGYTLEEVGMVFDCIGSNVRHLLTTYFPEEMRSLSQSKKLRDRKESAATNDSRAINLATDRHDLKPITHKTKDLRWGQDNYDINRREHIL